MGIVAHIQDIAVARTQKGKRMGLRVLEALVYAATEYGAYKVGIPLPEATQESCDQIQALVLITEAFAAKTYSHSFLPPLYPFSKAIRVLRTTY